MVENGGEPRYCKDCRHSKLEKEILVCLKSKDVVYGQPEDCRVVRVTENKCGNAGKWWQNKYSRDY